MNRQILGLVLFVMACATAQQGSMGSVSQAEIQASGAATAYDALSVLRPGWLRDTDSGQQLGVVRVVGEPPPTFDRRCGWRVYVGETGSEGDALHRIRASSIQEIRLIRPRQQRPDGSYCTHDYSAIHVVLVGGGAAP